MKSHIYVYMYCFASRVFHFYADLFYADLFLRKIKRI